MQMLAKKRSIDKIYKRRDRYEIPDWQREKVWSQSKKQNLIDTILRGWKLPKFYLLKLEDDPELYEVVDGQQRLNAIFEFFDNELSLSEESAKLYSAEYYSDLSDKFTDIFYDYEIEYDEISDASDEDIKLFFQRLQDGLPLTSSEKLNAVHSKLRDYIKKLTRHPFFKNISASDKRYGHFDILAKVAAIEIDGIDVGLRYDDLRAVFESQSNFSGRSNVATRIAETIDFVNKGFSQDAASTLKNRTLVQSLLTLVCRFMKSSGAIGKEKRVAEFYETFLSELNKQVELGQKSTDHDYLRFQRTINANVKDGARIRQEILLRKLLYFDPSFSELFEPIAYAEAGIQTAIRKDCAEIVNKITEVNSRYSSEHGIDLFKATTKTVTAQNDIGKPVKNYEEYEKFIDNLYFLFYEAAGSRVDDNFPEVFNDVNLLRIGIRHDIDHGREKDIKTKAKKIGETFKKYSGVSSPAGLAPEKFVVVQTNLIMAILEAMRSISW